MKWFQASYHSSNKVNHQKFIHYISLRVTYAEHQLGLNSQDLQPSPSQRPLHPALKSKAKAKPIQEVTPQGLGRSCRGRILGTSSGDRDPARDLHGDGSHGHPPSDHGRCDAGDHCPPPGFMSSSWLDSFEEADIHVSSMCQKDVSPGKTHSLPHKFHALVQQISKEASLARCDPVISNGCSRLHLLEVFCHEASELTKQVQLLGGRANRFGRAQGDLKTKEGRSVLFQMVWKQRPRHIWFSPTCGPWSAWNTFNEMRSIQLCEHVQRERERESHLFELALGVVLLRMSRQLGNHTHWEQPRKSIMFKTPLLQELYSYTQEANFDMCRVGQLTCPETNKLIQKEMAVRTTSQEMYASLHGRVCRRDHEHRPIAGSVTTPLGRITVSSYTENYPRKFARQVAKVMLKVKHEPWVTALVTRGIDQPSEESASKRIRVSSPMQKSQGGRLPPTPLEQFSNECKRRRIDGKTAESQSMNMSPQRQLEEIIKDIQPMLPRVGKTFITNHQILERLQNMFPEKEIKKVQACKGSDRTLPPPRDLVKNEAPYRHAIIVSRIGGVIQVEKDWEYWQDLSHRQQVRPPHPARVNITMYACLPQSKSEASGDSTEQNMSPEATGTSIEPQEATVSLPSSDQAPVTELDPDQTKETGASSSQLHMPSFDHGPKFKTISAEEESFLLKLHQDLGHPHGQKLCSMLRQQGYSPRLCQAAMDLSCSVCQNTKEPKHQRPSTIKRELDFNDCIGIDGVVYTNLAGTNFHFYHIIDYGTNYQVACASPGKSSDDAIDKVLNGWLQ